MSIASLPMYDLPEAADATEALWRGLARHFAEAGIEDVPAEILRRPRLPDHWLAPDLLFSQTCGYPFRNAIKGRGPRSTLLPVERRGSGTRSDAHRPPGGQQALDHPAPRFAGSAEDEDRLVLR